MKNRDQQPFILDLKGIACPHPTAIAINRLRWMEKGEVLEIITDSIGAEESITRLCLQAGHKILEKKNDAGLITIIIRK